MTGQEPSWDNSADMLWIIRQRIIDPQVISPVLHCVHFGFLRLPCGHTNKQSIYSAPVSHWSVTGQSLVSNWSVVVQPQLSHWSSTGHLPVSHYGQSLCLANLVSQHWSVTSQPMVSHSSETLTSHWSITC